MLQKRIRLRLVAENVRMNCAGCYRTRRVSQNGFPSFAKEGWLRRKENGPVPYSARLLLPEKLRTPTAPDATQPGRQMHDEPASKFPLLDRQNCPNCDWIKS